VTFKFDPKSKSVVATFDMPHASSDGGAVLPAAIGFIAVFGVAMLNGVVLVS
jgi:hypothetical protein